MRNQAGVWLAVALVAAGMVVLVDRLAPGTRLLERLAVWWPAIIIALGLGGMIRLVLTRNVLRGPFFVTVLGGLLLLVTVDPLPTGLRPFLLPGALVLVGLAVLVALAMSPRAGVVPSVKRVFVLFVPRTVRWPAGRFAMITVTAVGSGCVIDLTLAEPLNNRVRVELNALASGIDLVVRKGWRVEVDHRTLLRRKHEFPPEDVDQTQPVVEVSGLFLLSGLEVKESSPSK